MRDLKLDNAKGLLILLVVFGHMCEIFYLEKGYFQLLYIIIYSFHMPSFIFISGYFAKRANIKKVLNFLLLYIIFETIFLIFLFIATKGENYIGYVTPYFHLWYLVSVIFWYVLAIFIKKHRIKPFVILTIMFFVNIFSRLCLSDLLPNLNLYSFSLQRTLTFGLIFFLGYFMSSEALRKITTNGTYKIFGTVCYVSLMWLLINTESIQKVLDPLFRGSYGVNVFTGVNNVPAIYLLLLTLTVSIFGALLFISYLPNKSTMLIKFGQQTLPIFLFHPFFYIALSKIFPFIPTNKVMILALLVIGSILICIILSSKIFVSKTSYLLNPYDTLKKIKYSNGIKTLLHK